MGSLIVLLSGNSPSSEVASRPCGANVPFLYSRRWSDQALVVPYIRPPSSHGVISFNCKKKIGEK